MRKLLLSAFAVSIVAAPGGAVASSSGGDGTLAVRNATGVITMKANGGFIGRFEKGVVRILDPVEEDGTGPVISGCDRTVDGIKDRPILGGSIAVCGGTKIRFRLVGGRFNVWIKGTGIDLSVVGHGAVTLEGDGGPDGRYSLNDEEFRSMPNLEQLFQLGAPPAAP